MGDPINLAVKLVKRLVSKVKDVKTNHEGCRLLASLAEQSLCIMRQLEGRQFESSTERALELVNDALKEAQNAIDSCCNTNFITAMLYKQNLSLELKHAAARLEHALSLISLSSIEMTSDTQSQLVELSIQLRNARFEARAAEAHRIKDLKDVLERAFFQDRKDREKTKKLVQQLVREQASTHEELQKLLAMLREDSKEAKENKERQIEFEINEIIAVVTESLMNTKKVSLLTKNMKKSLCCPITQEWMRDPVMIKESGMTYERSSIEQWFNRGHCEDPLTNLALKSKDLVTNDKIRNLCQNFFGESRSSASTLSLVQTKSLEPRLEPGLYEGHGKFSIGVSPILAFQLLTLEPNGDAFCCTLYREENKIAQRNSMEVGKGEWTSHTFQLVYEDRCYFFHGTCEHEIEEEHYQFRWTGKMFSRGDEEGQNDFVFVHAPPVVSGMVWPSSGMTLMEGEVVSPGTQCKYNIKLLLSLEATSNVDGWMWFKQAYNKPKFITRVVSGSWNSNGSLSFNVNCSSQDTLPNSQTNPTNLTSSFEIDGKIERNTTLSVAVFTATFTKKDSSIILQKDELPLTPLYDLTSIELRDIRATSSSWHLLFPNGIQELYYAKSYKLDCNECTSESRFDVKYGMMSYYQHTWEESRLHIAAKNNAIDLVKELFTKGAKIECQNNDGETPLILATRNNAIDVFKVIVHLPLKSQL